MMMTTHEKAQQLIESYLPLIQSTADYNYEKDAILSSLTCLDHIFDHIAASKLEYWMEVREILVSNLVKNQKEIDEKRNN